MASSSWLPANGIHQVSIGTSLRRALKTRRTNGEQPASGSNKRIPDRDFYAFRYNFKPNSIDTDKPGNIDIRKTTDSTSITVEYPSKQNGETHVFKGSEHVAKEWDCVLVYDEELGTFTLEKLDSHAALTHERKPLATRPPAPASPKPTKVKDDLEAQLEKDLLDLADPDADAEGEDDFEEIIPKHVTYRKEEEEEDPLEELIAPTPPPLPPPVQKQPPPQRPPKPQTKAPTKAPQPPRTDKPTTKTKGKASAVPRPSSTLPSTSAKPSVKSSVKSSVKPPPKTKQAAAPPPAPVQAAAPVTAPAPTPAPPLPKPPSQTKTPRKREPEPATHLSDADEEVLEFGKPAKRTRKTSSVSAPAPVSGGLALPGTSSSVAPPPAIPSAPSSASSSSSSGRPLAAVVPQQQQRQQDYSGYALPSGSGGDAGGGGSESESEWSEVEPEAAIQGDDFFGDGVPGENEEVEMDEDEFEAELKQQMAEMEEEEEETGETRGAPMSLNDYARGVAGLSDEDTSTSEDSDDD